MKNRMITSAAVGILSMVMTFPLFGIRTALAEHRIGGGVHYWTAVEDIKVQDVDKTGFSGIISYQYLFAGFFRLEADLEIFPEGYVGAQKAVYQPQAYLVFGSGIYGALGMGINYSDGNYADDPFFALRAGIETELLPGVFLDINGKYLFQELSFGDVENNMDADAITLGAVLRLEF